MTTQIEKKQANSEPTSKCEPDTEMYWNGHDILTHNAMFNFVIGGRGTGKTFDCKYKRIKHFIKTGMQFIYLRRYKTEFDDKNIFFADVAQYFPGWEFKIEGMNGFIRHVAEDGEKPEKWRLMCYLVTLANSVTKKSVPYPLVDFIIYDEFIIDKGVLHYLQNEVKVFQDFYNTVDRFQDRVKVMFIANAVSIVNPYFIAYKLKPRKGNRFYKAHKGYMIVEHIENELFVEHVLQTRFGQMIKDTDYYDYAVGNMFHDDNDRFIAKKTKDAKFFFAIKFDGKVLGIWVDYEEGCYYVCGKYPKDCLTYVLTKEDMEPNLLMIERSSTLLKSVRKLYMQGSVLFDKVTTREFFMDILEYINIR